MQAELEEKCRIAMVPLSIQTRGGTSSHSRDVIAILTLGGGRTFSTNVLDYGKSGRYTRLMAALDLLAKIAPFGFIMTKLDESYNKIRCKANIGTRAKIEFTVQSDHNDRVERVFMVPYFRNASGAYIAEANTLDRSESWDKALVSAGRLAKDLSERTPPKITRKEIPDLPSPHQFKDADEFILGRHGGWVRNIGTIHWISVGGIYALDDSGRLSEASNPDTTDVWFLIDCTNTNPARTLAKCPTKINFQIIFNGDGWYQVARSGQRLKATGDTAKGKSLNLSILSTVDRELIEYAISRYVA